MKAYRGQIESARAVVDVDGRPLRFPEVATGFNPHEFEWGRESPGAASLAFAILADHLGEISQALRLERRFVRRVIAQLPPEASWTLTSAEIQAALGPSKRSNV